MEIGIIKGKEETPFSLEKAEINTERNLTRRQVIEELLREDNQFKLLMDIKSSSDRQFYFAPSINNRFSRFDIDDLNWFICSESFQVIAPNHRIRGLALINDKNEILIRSSYVDIDNEWKIGQHVRLELCFTMKIGIT